MKKPYKNHPLILGFGIILLCLLLSNLGEGDELVVTEHQVTASSAFETTPTLGNDGISDLVVFSGRTVLPDGSFAPGDIWYQRLIDGVPSGPMRQVPSGPTHDLLNDVSGDYIVYTAFESTTTLTGQIMLYQISTGILQPITDIEPCVLEPRIHVNWLGNWVVWVGGELGLTMIWLYNLDWLGTLRQPVVIAGPVPPASDVQIGDRYVVWSEETGGQSDVVAYDLAASRRIEVTDAPDIDERSAGTSGHWVVWQARDQAHGPWIEALNLDTGEARTIIDDGFESYRPSIHGDLIAYENTSTGVLDVYVYRISTDETFQVTSHSDHQYLNDVFGDLVAYVDQRTGSEDIFVSKMEFVPCYPELPAPELIVTGKEDYIGSDGQERTRYWLSVINWSEFPDELFDAAPDLPPCGGNPNASRTRAKIYNQDDTYRYGFCALSNPEQLTHLWFGILKGQQAPPESVYITLADRRCDITYTSNLASIPQWEDTVEALNQIIKTINGLESGVFTNPNLQTPLTNKINAVLEKIEQGVYQEALDKLEHDILSKTDGCANIGAPDMNDWIVDCEAQDQVYPLIIEAIEMLKDMI